jgi:hypothetical protein
MAEMQSPLRSLFNGWNKKSLVSIGKVAEPNLRLTFALVVQGIENISLSSLTV